MDPDSFDELARLARGLPADALADLVTGLPDTVVAALLEAVRPPSDVTLYPTPLDLAPVLVPDFRPRPHLTYLSERLSQALADVEAGRSRRLIVEMPPRMGKSLLATQITPAWILSRHPDWTVRLGSYSDTLANSWGKTVRDWVRGGLLGPQVALDAPMSKVSGWHTTAGGTFFSASMGQTATGTGARVLVIDDPVKDSVEAHSPAARKRVWEWWTSVGLLRLEPPSLVIVIMTRWHEDDLVGRLLSEEYPGSPSAWEVIRFPAVAQEDHDALGREVGDPLLHPLVEESRGEALERWDETREAVGAYVWSAMYQQAPAPSQGSVFDMDTFRYWTTDPSVSTSSIHDHDATTVLIADDDLTAASMLDSWDMAFKGTDQSDYVVGQRWARLGAYRLLVEQARGRWSFTETLAQVRAFASASSPYSRRVGARLVEEKANGAAIISSLNHEIAGFKPINPRAGKVERARAVTPEIESGHVLLPHPSMPGFAWVRDLVDELREFDHGVHDDQVDALTQALAHMRDQGTASVALPAAASPSSSPLVPGGPSRVGRPRPAAPPSRAGALRLPSSRRR